MSHADPKREVPDYDGRGNPDADGGSWVLWIPRVLLSPLYLANEYVVRRPLGAFIARAERDRWSDSVAQVFTFGAGGRHNLLVPTASFDLGMAPSVGFYYSRSELGAPDNGLTLQLATWGLRSIRAAAVDTLAIDAADRVQAGLELDRARDHVFAGLGPDATRSTMSRYGVDRVEGAVGFRRQMARAVVLAQAGVRRVGFLDGCCGDPTLDQRIARGEVMAPPGYRDDYTAAFGRLGLALDTRRPSPEPGSGVYLHLLGAPGVAERDRSWLRYGGELGGALDLTGERRTLLLQLAVDFTDPISGAAPFTEYPALGGEHMPGFLAGWLTGSSTATAQLGYTWPVWLGLDARTRLTVGNAWGAHLAGFSARELRMSADVGFTTTDDGDRGLEILLGLGTETFEQGAHVTSVRIALGWRPSS